MFNKRTVTLASFALLVCAVAWLSVPGTVGAVPRRAVPSFKVLKADGSPSNASDWKMQGNWILIYVDGRCGPCMHLLVELKKDRYPGLASHTIVVAGGMQPEQVAKMHAAFKNLDQATWYADPARNTMTALNLHGAPVTLGVQDGITRWGISGIPPVPGLMRALLKKWSAPPMPQAGFRASSK